MKALVTGGTGFIGSHVVRHLLDQGVDVRCLARKGSKLANLTGLKIEVVEGDLTNPASLRDAVDHCQMLFHVAADYRIWAKHPDELRRINVQGTSDILLAAADAGVEKIVLTSSVSAIGRPRENGGLGIGREDLEPTPDQLIGMYKRTKWESDKLARDYAAKGLPVVIVNPSTPVGSHDIKPTPTGKMIVDFLNRRMPAYIDTGLNFVDVNDVAAGHWLAAQRGRIGERYILGHRNMSLKEFLDLLASVAGLPAPKIKMPYAVAWMAGAVSTAIANVTGREPHIPLDGVRMAHETMYYDASKAVRELGVPQTPIQSALEKAVTWFKANGYIK